MLQDPRDLAPCPLESGLSLGVLSAKFFRKGLPLPFFTGSEDSLQGIFSRHFFAPTSRYFDIIGGVDDYRVKYAKWEVNVL